MLDRTITLFLNGSNSLFIDGLAWTATQTATWLPLLIVLLYVVIKNNNLGGVLRVVLGIALAILIADQVASSIFKPLVERWRPSNNPEFMYAVDVVKGYRGGNYGFFSSHAANTMAVATFLAFTIKNRVLTFWLYSWCLLNCWSRVYLGVHYVGDLLTGCLWGFIVGWAMYRFFIYRYEHQKNALPQQTSASISQVLTTHYSLASLHIFIYALALTYLYIIFKALYFMG